jgi:hypothetical protein
MAAQVPTREPDSLTAGETLTFKRTLADFPASEGWTLEYAFRGAGSDIEFGSTADGDDHLVEVAATTTAGWVPGTYYGQALAVNGAVTTIVWRGKLELLNNLAEEAGGFDPRTHARIVLDKLEDVIEGRAAHDVLESEIEGTKISRLSIDQLLKFRDRYAAIVASEEAALDPTKRRRRRILTRFVRPS